MHVVEKHVDKRKNIWFDYIIICQQIKYDWSSVIAENWKTKKIGGKNPQWLYLLYILYQYNIYNIISSTLDAQFQNIFYKYSRKQTFFFSENQALEDYPQEIGNSPFHSFGKGTDYKALCSAKEFGKPCPCIGLLFFLWSLRWPCNPTSSTIPDYM